MRFFRRGDERQKSSAESRKADPFSVYMGLRGIPLGEKGGPSEPFAGSRVVAVLMDWSQSNGTATIAAMADGTTSMYTSTGGGVIGAGAHAPVREANQRLMLIAQDHLDEFTPTTETPLPPQGHLAIVIRTTDDLRRAEVDYADLQLGKAQGQAVFDAANDVTTAIRIATRAQQQRRS